MGPNQQSSFLWCSSLMADRWMWVERGSGLLKPSSSLTSSTWREQEWPSCCLTPSRLQTLTSGLSLITAVFNETVQLQTVLFYLMDNGQTKHLLSVFLCRADFYKHIVLSGGTTMYPGLPSRLEREIKQLYLERVLDGDTQKLSVSSLIFVVFLLSAVGIRCILLIIQDIK